MLNGADGLVEPANGAEGPVIPPELLHLTRYEPELHLVLNWTNLEEGSKLRETVYEMCSIS